MIARIPLKSCPKGGTPPEATWTKLSDGKPVSQLAAPACPEGARGTVRIVPAAAASPQMSENLTGIWLSCIAPPYGTTTVAATPVGRGSRPGVDTIANSGGESAKVKV